LESLFSSLRTVKSHAGNDAGVNVLTDSHAFLRNRRLVGLRCLRCEFTTAELDFPNGCPECQELGHAANLFCVYEGHSEGAGSIDLPYDKVPQLGQGSTPLVPVPAGSLLRTGRGRAYFKLESANPTGSHKDRMAAYGVAHALSADKREVIAASSGNAGVSIAAFAAAVNLPCQIAVTPTCSVLYRALMEQHDAIVTECTDSLARWAYIADRCKDTNVYSLTNYALPAVGSPAIAIEGYKAIAVELAAAVQRDIDEVFVPVARGDLLWGLYLGFKELLDRKWIKGLPRLVAVEPFPRLALVLSGADYREQFEGKTRQWSTSGSTVTLQALKAVRRTNGRVEVIKDDEALRTRDRLARAGFSFELCAAAAYAAYLRSGNVANNSAMMDAVSVVIATANGRNDAL
jgi:threonine synthase